MAARILQDTTLTSNAPELVRGLVRWGPMSTSRTIEPPAWAISLAGASPLSRQTWARRSDELTARTISSDDASLVSLRVEDARLLGENGLRDATRSLYEELYREADALGGLIPIRAWNVIPGILEPLESLPHRYMGFNAGRHDAFLRRYGSEAELAARGPTATGVGSAGADLVVHALLAKTGGQPVENPRQVPAWKYSTRFGPRPPCFARATRVDHASHPWLLVGGTASVVGEESRHPHEVDAQLGETAQNIRALLQEAGADGAKPKSLRAYFVRDADEGLLRRRIPQELGLSGELELVRAELCRPELVVEIEGLYVYPGAEATAAA